MEVMTLVVSDETYNFKLQISTSVEDPTVRINAQEDFDDYSKDSNDNELSPLNTSIQQCHTMPSISYHYHQKGSYQRWPINAFEYINSHAELLKRTPKLMEQIALNKQSLSLKKRWCSEQKRLWEDVTFNIRSNGMTVTLPNVFTQSHSSSLVFHLV